MKKIIALFLAAGLAFSFCACNKDTESDKNKDNTESAEIKEENLSADSNTEESNGDEESAEAQEKIPPVSELGDLSKYIELGTWKGVSVAKKAEVTEELTTEIREELLANKTTQAEKTDAAEMGDTVIIDYKGYFVDSGEAFSGGEDKGSELLLGSGRFVPGFEEGVVGHYPGESFDIYLTFPEDYHEDLAGKEVRFAIVLVKITETVYPEVDDDLAKELGYKDAADFESVVLDKAEHEVYTENLATVWTAVLAGVKVKEYPAAQLEAYRESFIKYHIDEYSYYATVYGMELGEYMKTVYGMTEEEFRTDLEGKAKDYAKAALKEEMTLYAVADAAFNREISDEEYKEKLAEYAEKQKTTPEEMEKAYGKEYLLENMIGDKVMVIAYENAVFGTVNQ